MTGAHPPTDTRAKTIFGDALDLDPGARAGFIEGACAGDETLKRRVLDLLAAARDDGFLAPADGDAVSAGERPGERIGPYKLIEQIGEGGFGVVFMAEQERPVRRLLALKIIKLGMDTRAVIARFEQERQALALMDHPNIARVVDAGASESGRPYFVMDLVKGEPITEFADRRSLPVRERLALFLQVCSAIQHAHIKGVIHRDIKPSNILVSEHEGRPLARVIDFGIAKATALHLTERTLVTGFHQLIGTPAYMSPEQAAGSLDVDTRSDVYSLGVLLYELLTGVTPLDEATLRKAPFADLQKLIRDHDPPTPSTRLSRLTEQLPQIAARRGIEPRRLGALLRADLDWIVMKALERDRARRYDSPGTLAADIERSLAGKPVEAAPPGVAYRVRKFVGRHKGGVIAATLVGAALLLGAVGTSVGMVRARSEAQRATRNARIAESASTLMTTTMKRANRGREGGRADLTVREVMDDAARELTERPGTHEPAVEHALARSIGDTYRELSLYEPAEGMFRIEAARARAVYGEHSLQHGEALDNLGQALKTRGSLDEAALLYDQARDIFTAAGAEGESRLAMLRVNIGLLRAARQDLDGAEHQMREAIAYFERVGSTIPEYYLALRNLALVHYRRGHHDKALPLVQRDYDFHRASYGDDDARTVEALHNLTVLLATTGAPGAQEMMRRELASMRRLHGDDHELVADLLGNLGGVLLRNGDPGGAADAYRQALAILEKRRGPDHPETINRAVSLAGVHMELGQDAEAEPLLRRSLAVFDRVQAGDSRTQDSVICRYYLGSILIRRGQLDEAERVGRRAVTEAEAFKTGDRYEWMRSAAQGQLAAALAEQASVEASPREPRIARIDEAESLVIPAAERLLELAPAMGPRTRRREVAAMLNRVVRVCEVASTLDPTEERTEALHAWKQKREQAEREQHAAP